mmetsp:Transcript_7316/g.26583  ORF Transcript_7316/g.26583 Transcript_7316/m.26583 type:complete len:234 (-) Transcript_7316:1496-2197(-)
MGANALRDCGARDAGQGGTTSAASVDFASRRCACGSTGPQVLHSGATCSCRPSSTPCCSSIGASALRACGASDAGQGSATSAASVDFASCCCTCGSTGPHVLDSGATCSGRHPSTPYCSSIDNDSIHSQMGSRNWRVYSVILDSGAACSGRPPSTPCRSSIGESDLCDDGGAGGATSGASVDSARACCAELCSSRFSQRNCCTSVRSSCMTFVSSPTRACVRSSCMAPTNSPI